GYRTIEVLRSGGAADASRYGRIGHRRGSLGGLVADAIVLLDVRERLLAEVVPDRSHRRHDIRLIAAVGDHEVGTLLGAKVLTAFVPGHVHQLDCIDT